MKMKYLGTAAAEGIPALFCQCPLCKKARELKGKDIRGRSGLVIDDEFMIDFPPDILTYVTKFDLDLSKIKHLIVTHSHTDHFAPADLVLRQPGCYCNIIDGEPTIYVYGNNEVLRLTKEALITEYGTDQVDFLQTNPLTAFQKTQIGNFCVTPLPAMHKLDEEAYIYLVEKNNITLLYAHDTGFFSPSVFQYLQENKLNIDVISLDCTCCANKEGTGHMGLPDDVEILKKLRANQNITDQTKCIVNHFSHNGLLTHAQLVKEAQKHGMTVAYDGMEVDLPYDKCID